MVRTSKRKRGRGRPARDGIKKAVQHVMPYKQINQAITKDLHPNDQTAKHAVKEEGDNSTFKEGHVGANLEISSELERELATCIFSAANTYFGLLSEEVRRLAYQFVMKQEQPVSPAWMKHELASEGWFAAFLKQNPTLPITSSEATHPPGECGLHRNNAHMFFSRLEDVMKRCCFRPEVIWYMDEIGVAVADVPHRVGIRRDYQQVAVMTSAELSCPVTVTCSVSAAGTTIPPFFVFPRSGFREDFLTGAPVGSSGSAHPNSWMRKDQFIDFLKHFVHHSNCSPERPCLLLTDNHDSYLSIEALDFARENGVMWMTFPNHCLHLRWPMEWSVYGQIETHIRAAIEGWLLASAGRALTIHYIPAIIASVLPLATTPRNIKAGFKACGIFPLNPDIAIDFPANHLTPSETHPHSKPTCICNGADHADSAENHIYTGVAHDSQGHASDTECSHTLSPGASTATNGQTAGCVDVQESSEEDEGFCQVCMDPHSNSEVACQQCTVSRKWTQSDDMDHTTGITLISQPQSAPQAAHNTDVIMDDILEEDTHKLQNYTYCDATSPLSGDNHTHPAPTTSQDVENNLNHSVSVSTCTNRTSDLTHHATSPTHSIENHTHTALVPTADEAYHTHFDSVPTSNTQDHTSECHGEEEVHSAPASPLCFPLSPIPGSSTEPAGRTPGHLDSSESSDEDEGVCQVCMERFPHSNSEVLCLQCVLRRKWGQSDDTDLSLDIPFVATPLSDLDTDDSTEVADQSTEPNPSIHEESHDFQKDSHSNLSPTCNVGNDSHSMSQPTGELDNSPNQSPSTSTDGSSDPTHHTAVSSHNINDHTHGELEIAVNTQDHTCEIPMEQDCYTAEVSECTPSPIPGPSTEPTGQTLGHPDFPAVSTEATGRTPGRLDSPESSNEDESVCQMRMDPFEHSNTEGPNPSIHEDSHDLQNYSHSDSSPTHNVRNDYHSVSQPTGELDNSPNQSPSTSTDGSSDPTQHTTVSSHNIKDHTHRELEIAVNTQDHPCEIPMEQDCYSAEVSECTSSPIPGLSTEPTGHLDFPGLSPEPTGRLPDHLDSPESLGEDESVHQMRMDPFEHSNTEGPNPSTHEDSHDLQNYSHSDSSPTHNVGNDSHSTSQPTGELDNSPNQSPSTPSDGSSDPTHHTAVSSHNIKDHTHGNLVFPLNTQDHTCEIPMEQGCYTAEVSECTPSPIPGPSTEPTGQTLGHPEFPGLSTEATGKTPGRLDSPESTKKDESVCQMRMDPFEHSNTEGPNPSTHEDSHGLQNYCHSDSSPTHNVGNDSHSMSQPTCELDNSPNQSPSTPTDGSSDPTHHTAVSSHNINDHSHKELVFSLNTQDHPCEIPMEQECYTAEVSKCTPSPIPGPSTEPTGQTPGHPDFPGLSTELTGRLSDDLDSPESSDDEGGVCQVCMETFEHSNSEVMCLRCVLQKKWGQSGLYF
ncbi:hypothetical protein ACEWY4_008058 [Coilia grayii]|uniref:DDE-1 domain-containing protein n=1 Tax=Coilia grayii TaxID=363190 RepID=A0ABD1K9S0_9TELE